MARQRVRDQLRVLGTDPFVFQELHHFVQFVDRVAAQPLKLFLHLVVLHLGLGASGDKLASAH